MYKKYMQAMGVQESAAPTLAGPSGVDNPPASTSTSSAPCFIAIAPPVSPFEQLDLQQPFEPPPQYSRFDAAVPAPQVPLPFLLLCFLTHLRPPDMQSSGSSAAL